MQISISKYVICNNVHLFYCESFLFALLGLFLLGLTSLLFNNRDLSLSLPIPAVDSLVRALAKATICTAPLCFPSYFLSCAWLHASRERGKLLATHQISTNMGKLTDIYNVVWRLHEYSIFCLLRLQNITFLQHSFLVSKVLESWKGDRMADRHRRGV